MTARFRLLEYACKLNLAFIPLIIFFLRRPKKAFFCEENSKWTTIQTLIWISEYVKSYDFIQLFRIFFVVVSFVLRRFFPFRSFLLYWVNRYWFIPKLLQMCHTLLWNFLFLTFLANLWQSYFYLIFWSFKNCAI